MRRIIGCGNQDRGDDGAGILAARRLRDLGVDAVEHCGDGTELLDFWTGNDEVILIDAMVSGQRPGTVSIWDPIRDAKAETSVYCSTHSFGPYEAIELARALHRLPREMRIYGIEGANFEPGGGPCREVLAAVGRVVEDIALTIAQTASDAPRDPGVAVHSLREP